jgi:LuxR family maltose regulon positive regulatory protein
MTAGSVIRTKLYPPISRSPLIERERLLALLEQHGRCTLTLVAAPAGFGKTTILGQWFQRLRDRGERCCWCSLDREDAQPQRFLRHVVGALRTASDIGADVVRQLDSTLIADICDTLPALINGIGAAGHEVVLFLDDLHYGRSEQINRFVETLVNLAPPNLRIVIASRLRPQLSLSGLRVKSGLCEITVKHLRFDTDEAREFMRRTGGLDLTAGQLDRLYEHSEGWAAGLQLASLSLHDTARRDAFIASFSGSLREIADYLASDVIGQLEPEIRDFLLRTSILDRVSAGAADAVTGSGRAQELLNRVETGNLFLVPLDNTREWYRFHHLFQEFLQAELRRVYPDETVSLYRRASDWFAEAGFINEAINYALLSGDMLKVGRLVHSGTLEKLAMDGKMTELLSWVHGIPQNIKARFPRLLIQECIALSHLCRSAAAADVTAQAQAAIRQLDTAGEYPYTGVELKQLREEAFILPFMVAFCRDDAETINVAELESIDSDDDLIRGIAGNFLGHAALQRFRLDEADRHLRRARCHHVTKGTYYGAVFSDCFLAMSSLQRYRLHDAYEHALAAESLVNSISGGHIAGLAKAKVMQAVVLLEWNRADDAQALLESNLPTIETAGQASIAQAGFLALARCYSAHGDPARARRLLDRCLQVSAHTNLEHVHLVVELEKSRIAWAHGEGRARSAALGRIRALLDQFACDSPRVAFAQLLLLLHEAVFAGHLDRVEREMRRLCGLCAERNLKLAELQLSILSAAGFARLGETGRAVECLAAAIAIAAPQNGVRPFMEAGGAIAPLLGEIRRRHARRGNSSACDFASSVESALIGRTARAGAPPESAAPGVVESLSNREIEIIELMARGDSNAMIGSHLMISENTVKWHVKNLFAKLGVTNRTAAVIAAQQGRSRSPGR